MAHDIPPDDAGRLDRALMSLRATEREVLLLSAREKLRTDQIAARLGISPSDAVRLLARALAKLDRALDRRGRPWWRFW
jgi:RNA polymerase sigma factor (sigma-70 family)